MIANEMNILAIKMEVFSVLPIELSRARLEYDKGG